VANVDVLAEGAIGSARRSGSGWRPRKAHPPCRSARHICFETIGSVMITLEDCIAFCGLSREEVQALAEHEHIPEIAAAAFGEYLLKQRRGPEKIHEMIVEDIRAALHRGDRKHAHELFG